MKIISLWVCLLMLAFSSPIVVAQGAPQAPLADAVILIVRHAEKPDSGSGLTPAGQQRAVAYIRYFRHYQIDAVNRLPDHLVASADSKNSRRPRLTVEPLSKALRLPIDDRFRDKDVASLADALETRSGGKTILICWHHKEIPELLQALGADPDTLLPHGRWPSDVYNWVIQLRYDLTGHLLSGQAKRINEHLLPGDAD